MADQDRYQIQVQGWIDRRWAGWLDGMIISYQGTEQDAPLTVLTGPVVDQAALRGLLSKIWDLNLCVLAVNRIETGSE